MYNAQYMINAMHMASKQNQAKNKKMKMKANRFHPGILAAAAFALATGCAGNDSTDEDSMQGNTTAAVRLTDFASAANPDASSKRMPMSRTSMQNHHYLTGGEFMWEPGDKIYVKDDDNTMQNSGSNSNITATQPTARFQLPGKYDGSTYEVYYTGTATTANASTVTIASSQTQAAPNDTKHFGASGDCGTATATRVGDHFEFMLDHKASYLCFLPRVTNAALAPNVYLTKIVVKSDNAIAGDYTLSLAGLGTTPTGNAASEITLTTQGNGTVNGPWNAATSSYTQVPAPGFPLPTATSIAANAAYMVIAPGTHSLTVDYYIKDPVTNVEGFITKTLPVGKNYEANKVYDVTANLTPKDYSDRKYYMWDAQQEYWHSVSAYPIVTYQSNSNYAQNSSDPRWHNITTTTQATQSCQTAPNANEIIHYVMNGDPHWDNTTLWSTNGHLYRNGVWFKKGSKITNFSGTSYEGVDYRTLTNIPIMTNNNVAPGKPSNTENYFYLPALGYNFNGTISVNHGYYWSSSPTKAPNLAFSAYLYPDNVSVRAVSRTYGFQNWTWE